MRRAALVVAVLGVLAVLAAVVVGLLGVSTTVAGESYDCGSAGGRLGGDEREKEWAEDAFLTASGDESIPRDELQNVACKEKTDDRLNVSRVLGPLGLVLLAVAAVLFWRSRPRQRPVGPVGSQEAPA